RAFVAKEYWTVDTRLSPNGDDAGFLARLIQIGEDKLAASPDKSGLVLSAEADAQQHVDRLREASYRVREVREREVKRSPSPPFTTSTLQQEAARKLGFSSRKTMRVAQQLYEGVDLPGEGQVGLITYMRTDSVTIAEQALRELADVVREQFGQQYMLFDGFRRVYFEGREEEEPDEDAEARLPQLTAEQVLRLLELLPEQHFTQPPPRYSEASLVKALEELGIGRPSTYASIITVLLDREYVRLESRRFYPQDVGEVVTDLLVEHFPDIVDVNFTAHMEEELDDIAE